MARKEIKKSVSKTEAVVIDKGDVAYLIFTIGGRKYRVKAFPVE